MYFGSKLIILLVYGKFIFYVNRKSISFVNRKWLSTVKGKCKTLQYAATFKNQFKLHYWKHPFTISTQNWNGKAKNLFYWLQKVWNQLGVKTVLIFHFTALCPEWSKSFDGCHTLRHYNRLGRKVSKWIAKNCFYYNQSCISLQYMQNVLEFYLKFRVLKLRRYLKNIKYMVFKSLHFGACWRFLFTDGRVFK